MLEDRPVLKDRLTACGVFSGIAIAAVAGMEMIIGGGFDFLTPGRQIQAVAPSAYVQIAPSDWFSDARVIPLSSREPLFVGNAYAADARLVGASDDASAPDGAYPDVDEEALGQQIDALYADTSDGNYEATPTIYTPAEELPPIAEVEASVLDDNVLVQDEFDGDDPKSEKTDVSAFESASPW